ncbi:MFS transporter [Streptomyces sp. CBMA156]|uniref:MFS transporter n=1 Tax=Streptomyces sp. CBMA156 TaxID=1930280 RepID=UPI00166203A0|nr:MFS transporter [Streptomyces sp. CBMA156]MBD0669886.1 MFS transporter [Streptomyces sp. CBMA156]MBD0673335.1 MFS transporter [Streptomyces sp. CBMA156]
MSTTRQPSAGPVAPSGRGRPWLLAALAMLCCGWGGNQFTPLLLMYRDLGGYSEVTVDAFLGAYVLGLVPGLLVGGAASDRYGRRPLMIGAVAVSLAASGVLCGGVTGELPIYAGRFLTGIAVGIAMAVGTSWVKELSQAPHDPAADPGAGARRASLALTLGFGLGAGVAGVLAQWGPWPMVTPYLAHLLVTLPALFLLPKAVETRARTAAVRGLWADLKVPAAGHRRFVRVILPMAPWVFGSAGVAYAVTPQLVGDRLGHWSLAYATLLTVLTLGTGALVQPFAKRLDSFSSARGVIVSMVLMACGMAVCAGDAALRSPLLGLCGAVFLGAAYGIGVVSGLLEIQRIVTPDDLAGITGVYYALCYSGFLLPAALAALSPLASYAVMLSVVTALALASLAVIVLSSRRHLPAPAPVPVEVPAD